MRLVYLVTDGFRHGAQVDGQVGRIGDQGAVRAEQGAAEVQALLDVHADGGALQHSAHLLSYAHESAPTQQASAHLQELSPAAAQ